MVCAGVGFFYQRAGPVLSRKLKEKKKRKKSGTQFIVKHVKNLGAGGGRRGGVLYNFMFLDNGESPFPMQCPINFSRPIHMSKEKLNRNLTFTLFEASFRSVFVSLLNPAGSSTRKKSAPSRTASLKSARKVILKIASTSHSDNFVALGKNMPILTISPRARVTSMNLMETV